MIVLNFTSRVFWASRNLDNFGGGHPPSAQPRGGSLSNLGPHGGVLLST